MSGSELRLLRELDYAGQFSPDEKDRSLAVTDVELANSLLRLEARLLEIGAELAELLEGVDGEIATSSANVVQAIGPPQNRHQRQP